MKKNVLLISLVLLVFNAFGRDGIYIEFKVTSTSSSMSMSGTNKSYYSGGDSRNEMTMQSSSMPGPMSMVTIILSSAPGKAYSINEKDKTYSETDITKAMENKDDDEYDITVHGNENVNGYNAVHVTVVNRKTQHSSEMWVSKDVKGYSSYTSVKSKYLGGSKFFDALKAQGADGFVVRMVVDAGRGGKIQMDLVTAEMRDIDASLLTLSGYTSTSGSAATPGGMERPNVEQIQKMTPEERQKYIEEMKAKYGQH